MRVRTAFRVVAAATLLALAAPTTARAQVEFGPQLSYGNDTDIGIGGRVLVNVRSLEHWDFIGTFDVFFPDAIDYWEINANLAYNFLIEDVESLLPYAGGGLNIAHASIDTPGDDASDTELGLNLFGGTKFRSAGITPFAEIRLVIEGVDQLVLTGGILF